ncbi:RagB/SusD family nutrient uptake outer membrane protein [Mangrovibacterium sp.]|uniref:RagB/SusD family nutrient uptake outer membrane protein n=1 Tax=Mangrovibacterium sp. TaxID=1961364 RepID=UPI003561838F
MKFIKHYKIIAGLSLLACVSCSESFLEVSPKGALTSETYLKTDDEAKTALIGVYNTMQHNFSNGSWASVFFIKNLPADDCLAGSSEGDQTGYQNIDDFAIQTDNAKLELIYTNFYRTINRANTVIDRVEGDSDAKVEIIAEAKAIRAYCYLELVTLFGGVPLMTVNPVGEAEYHKPRATAAEIYDQIEQDLTEAILDLPLKSAYSENEKFRFSKGTAQAFLGKAYLYQERYSEAITQLSAVISSGEYDLVPDFADVWSKSTEFGVESLFEISYTSNSVYDWGTFPWGGGNESNIEVQLQGPRSDLFDLTNCTLPIINGWGFNMPSAKIGQAFEDEEDDVRGAATVLSAADFIASGGAIKDPNAHDYEGYMRMKYVTRSTETGDKGIAELNYSTNWRLLRYADVLLMAAEAYHFDNQDGKAVIELNKVRTRAEMPAVSTSDDVFAVIVKERQLELAFEGSRYWDLVRWGLAAQELGSLGFQTGKHELFPIPQNEIIANNGIDAEDQNPGY